MYAVHVQSVVPSAEHVPENAMAAFEMALDQNDEFTEAPEAKWRLKILSGLS